MTPDQLVDERIDDLGNGEGAGVTGQLRVKHALQQDVAEFALERGRVAAVDGVEGLVRFFDEIGTKALVGLNLVPRAAARRAENGHDAYQPRERRGRLRRGATPRAGGSRAGVGRGTSWHGREPVSCGLMLAFGRVRVRFLGTGTSHGVPMIGCDCDVCRSTDPRDHRLRSSIYLEGDEGQRVLVDTTTDLRTQALAHGLRRVDAVLFTHSHADHVMGLDELRRFNVLSKQPMPIYGTRATLADLQRMFAYVFHSDAPRGGGVPDLRLWPLEGAFCLAGFEIVPVPVRHGPWEVLGFRIGRFAYVTDCNSIPTASMQALAGVEVLVLDALRRKPHPTHFSLDEAVAVSQAIGARETYFTHIAHDLGHAATCADLPAGTSLAYDGLVLDV